MDKEVVACIRQPSMARTQHHQKLWARHVIHTRLEPSFLELNGTL